MLNGREERERKTRGEREEEKMGKGRREKEAGCYSSFHLAVQTENGRKKQTNV